MNKRRLVVISLIILGLSGLIFCYQQIKNKQLTKEAFPEKTTYSKNLEITAQATYAALMTQALVNNNLAQQIFLAAKPVYDLSKIRTGNNFKLVYEVKTNELKQLVYAIDTEQELLVTRSISTTTPEWLAKILPINYQIKIKTVAGTIDSSLYESALAQNLDERAVIAFADAFQWSVDFAWEVRKGDTYKFIYEERYRDGQYVMPGEVLAGKFVNDGKTLYAFYYQESAKNFGYFDEQGKSAQKIFLKAPLAFKYISSAFTTGLRYVSAFNVSTGHRAVDYAATYGTPIRAVGDGTVSFAGWNGAYGQMVKIRHNATYSTNYGHMSKMAVKAGQRVKQSQTIGYVGSTGFSTGPHLHYEMVKNGTKINPLKEVFPPSQGIKEENKAAYLDAIANLKRQLEQ